MDIYERVNGSIIMSGTLLAKDKMKEQKDTIEWYRIKHGYNTHLVVIQLGDHQASNTYVGIKRKRVEEASSQFTLDKLDEDTTTKELIDLIKKYNEDPSVTGILVQKPLPVHIDEYLVDCTIDPIKDVDGFNPVNIAKLYMNREDAMVPCTALGIVALLDSMNVRYKGSNVIVLGRSNLVGTPVSMLLKHRDATVFQLHSKTDTEDFDKVFPVADIIISCMGNTNHEYNHLLTTCVDRKYQCKELPYVIDCGTNRDENNRIVGDLDYDTVTHNSYAHTTPVGGVGPMTVSCLIDNLIKAAKIQKDLIGGEYNE